MLKVRHKKELLLNLCSRKRKGQIQKTCHTSRKSRLTLPSLAHLPSSSLAPLSRACFLFSCQNSLRSNGNDNNAEQPPDCEIELVTGKKVPRPSSSTNDNDDDDPNVLFSPKPNDICHMLRHGSRFTIAYTARPQMTHPHHASNTTLSPPTQQQHGAPAHASEPSP